MHTAPFDIDPPGPAPIPRAEPIKHQTTYIERSMIDVVDSRNVRNFGAPIDKEDPSTIELAKSIAKMGMIKPVTVIAKADGRYALDTGYRRLCAADLAKVESIFAIVIAKETDRETEVDRLERVIAENERAEPLTPAELGFACAAMRQAAKEGGVEITNYLIAQRVGKHVTHVANLLRCVDNLIPPIMAAWKGERGTPLATYTAVEMAALSPADQAVAWQKHCGKLDAEIGRGDWHHKPPSGAQPGPRAPKIREMRDALPVGHVGDVRAALDWVLGDTLIPPIRIESRSRNRTPRKHEGSPMTIQDRSHPLVPNAYMQGLAQCEGFAQLDKHVARYKQHKGQVGVEDQKNIEAAIARQEGYLEGKGLTRPPVAPPSPEEVARREKAAALRAQLAELGEADE